MVKKVVMVGFKTTLLEKNILYQQAAELGFLKGSGKPNFSSFCRWILNKGKYPICRKRYDDLVCVNLNLIRLGGLFNQTIHNINKERFILNDKGFYDENNKLLLKSLNSLQAQYTSLKNELDKMKKITQEIVNIEGA